MEHRLEFPCFGGTCSVTVAGTGWLGPARQAAAAVRAQLSAWHAQFSRFTPDSELAHLNADPAPTVAASPVMLALAQAIVDAAKASGGLVDATLARELGRAGYRKPRQGGGIGLRAALARAPERRAARPDARRQWATISVDLDAGTVSRRPGVRMDGGGLAKGLFADLLAGALHEYDRFVVDCCGDLRLGGSGGGERDIEVESPFDGQVAYVARRSRGAAATSGIGRRGWTRPDGRPAHHVLDPSTGEPAYTGLVQATAFAPTASEAEWRSTAALLAGPDAAATALVHGGVLFADDGALTLVR